MPALLEAKDQTEYSPYNVKRCARVTRNEKAANVKVRTQEAWCALACLALLEARESLRASSKRLRDVLDVS